MGGLRGVLQGTRATSTVPSKPGTDDAGHGNEYCFLAVEPDPDEWRIVVQSDGNGWFETAGTFCDFLVRCFDRIDRPPFMTREWPTPGARHHSHV